MGGSAVALVVLRGSLPTGSGDGSGYGSGYGDGYGYGDGSKYSLLPSLLN